jgi:anti-anti-sigma factor
MDVLVSYGPVTTISVDGDIDSYTFPELVKQVEEVINRGYANLVLDLEAVSYISSAGLIALQTIQGQATNQGGRAVLSGVNKRVGRILDVAGFTPWFNIYPHISEAVASFG